MTYFVRRRGKRLIGPIESAKETRQLLRVLDVPKDKPMIFLVQPDGGLREVSRQQLVTWWPTDGEEPT